MSTRLALVSVLLFALLASACAVQSQPPTPTWTPTPTATRTPTRTPTPTPTPCIRREYSEERAEGNCGCIYWVQQWCDGSYTSRLLKCCVREYPEERLEVERRCTYWVKEWDDGSHTSKLVKCCTTVAKKTEWAVSWYTLSADGKWGGKVGDQTFPSTFYYNWKSGSVFGQYSDYIGFHAFATINVQRIGPVRFIVGCDAACRLFVDGLLVINSWERSSYREIDKTMTLAPGKHQLQLDYYEWAGNAAISFRVDADVLEWVEPVCE